MPSLHATFLRMTATASLLCCTWGAHAQPQDLVDRARKGDAVAQNELGKMYLSGKDVKASPQEAFKWFLLAAKQGLPNAQANVSQSYLLGLGIKEDRKQAELWAKKAADQNFAGGYHLLGLVHEDQWAMSPEEDKARHFFHKAALMGLAPAQHKYGERVLGGGPKYVGDPEEAEKWLRLSAEQAYAPAQHALGELYKGRSTMSIAKPVQESCKWFYAAYAQDPTPESPSHNEVQQCNKELSSAQIEAIKASLPRAPGS